MITKFIRSVYLFLAILPLIGQLPGKPVQGQAIRPSSGSQTVVTPNGNRYEITGGTLSGDRINLFHRFERFNLNSNEIANFISSADIQNILAQIVGGEISFINGLIQVSGSQANLFLINPAGIIFGSQASLNIPASFVATTANQIGWEGGWLNVLSDNDYTQLVGNPTAYRFDSMDPGAIANWGNLSVLKGENLSLLAGSILNGGTLSAANGNVILAAVPGQSTLRLSQSGQILALEITPVVGETHNLATLTITPLSIPQLLSGGNLNPADQLQVQPDGRVTLQGSGLAIANGDIVVVGSATTPALIAEQANLWASGNVTLVGTQIHTNSHLNIAAGNQIQIRQTLEHPFIARSGGNTTLRGQNGIDIWALNSGGQPAFAVGGDLNLFSDGIISGDAHFAVGGNLRVENLVGEAGEWVSYFDPIIRANGNVSFGDYTGVSLKVEAGGAIVGGDITITGPDTTLVGGSDPEIEILQNSPALILRSGVPELASGSNEFLNETAGGTNFVTPPGLLGNDLSVRVVSTPGGPVILESTGEIVLDAIATLGGRINLDANRDITALGPLNSSSDDSNGGPIRLNAGGNINTDILNSSSSFGSAGDVNLNARGNIRVASINAQGSDNSAQAGVRVLAGNLFTATSSFRDRNQVEASISTADGGQGGIIQIQHRGGTEAPFIIGDPRTNGTDGAITTGSATISPSFTVPVPPNQFRRGNITLIAGDEPSVTDIPETSTPTIATILTPGEATPASPIITPGEINGNVTDPLGRSALRTVEHGDISSFLDAGDIPSAVLFMDILYTEQLGSYIQQDVKRDLQSFAAIQDRISAIAQATGSTPAIIYTLAREDQLDLILVPPQGVPIHRTVPAAQRPALQEFAKQFIEEITAPNQRITNSYLTSAQQLYQWLIAPLEADLTKLGIDTLVFSMDTGLRGLPLAALHDGKQFLVEKYSIGLIPSVNLTDTEYRSLENAKVLAMGASLFADLPALPGVPVEIGIVTAERSGESFLNENFTFKNLKKQRENTPFRIVHLATHAVFQPGDPSNSYIQLWDSKLALSQLRQLEWNNPPVDLLVLSACSTALGDEGAELGFAGLAVQAGVQSALASLWSVSDEATVALMSEFYSQLSSVPIKSQALRQAQIAMIRGEVRIENGLLVGTSRGEQLPLSSEIILQGNQNLSHPYHWAGFTIIGSPW